MNLANKITIFRVLMIPVFCALVFIYSPEHPWARIAALGVYAIAAFSDVVDGYVARHWNQRTQFGVRLDPLADKWLQNLGFIFIAANVHFEPGIPLWFPPLILARDVALAVLAFLVNEYVRNVHIQPRFLGKATTFVQVCLFIAVLLQVPIVPWLIYATLALVVLSTLDYFIVNARQLEQQDPA